MSEHGTTSQRDPLVTAYVKFVDAVRETLDIEAGLREALRQAPSAFSDAEVAEGGEGIGDEEFESGHLAVEFFEEFIEDVRQTLDIEAGLLEVLGQGALASSYTQLVGDIGTALDVEGGLDAITPGASPSGEGPARATPAFAHVESGAAGTTAEEVASYLIKHGDPAVRFRLRESIDMGAWELWTNVRAYLSEYAEPALSSVESIVHKLHSTLPFSRDLGLLTELGPDMRRPPERDVDQLSDQDSLTAAQMQCFEELNEAISLVEHQTALFAKAAEGRDVFDTSRVIQYEMLNEELRALIAAIQSSATEALVSLENNGTLRLLDATFSHIRDWRQVPDMKDVFAVSKRLADLADYGRWLNLIGHSTEWCQLHLANAYLRGLLEALPLDCGPVARWIELASMEEIFQIADIALTNFIGADLRHADLSYDTPLSGIRWSARSGSATHWPEEWVMRIREMSEEEEAGSDIYVIRNDWRHAEDNLTLAR